MKNLTLEQDYIRRAAIRLKAVDTLFNEQGWADVVRESQEIVELSLKAMLRAFRIEVPRIHDVSDILIQNRERFPAALQAELEILNDISRSLRRDRELAFYGSEDLTPSDFYRQKDAVRARNDAKRVVSVVTQFVIADEP